MRGIGAGGDDYGRNITQYIFPKPEGYRTKENLRYYRSLITEPHPLEVRHFPMFVRFRDLNKPQTIENLLKLQRIDGSPAQFTIEKSFFEEAFGEGVSLRSVTIEMTNEPVEIGQVTKFLPWFLDRMRSHTIGSIGGTPNKPFEDPSETYLTSKNFIQGYR